MSCGSEKRGHSDKGKPPRIYRSRSCDVLGQTAKEESKGSPDEKSRRENPADRAGSKSRGRCQDFENKDDGKRLPKPLIPQNSVHCAVAVAAHFRVPHGQGPDDQTAQE